ncbi:MAG TPA: hypothetical protein IGS52_11160 [Oscillatoriaceae cyanobacterium M33_DOE_052]|uniref:Uncharacterized protein n=1 Tax=Planktothricoides sp. SpSt-374 TaxID=2282167 RepID=A0A7C3VT74_9CYAN|nr:hypothetical protein [Oscillatoriaceae cyanobacterium M33_DOE_052]
MQKAPRDLYCQAHYRVPDAPTGFTNAEADLTGSRLKSRLHLDSFHQHDRRLDATPPLPVVARFGLLIFPLVGGESCLPLLVVGG